jgi:hypothetical protein
VAGRVHRPDALREQLGLRPDTAVAEAVAAGYARWGERLLERIDGPFALVVWDGERCLLAQDPLGGRSLFTFSDGPRLCFATEITVLLGLLRRRPDPDELALAHHLVDHSVPDGRMLFHGITRLGGGELLELGDAGRARRSHWAPRYAPALREPRGALAARLRSELETAVGDDLPADALLLSGGLDSSVVAALAAPRAPGLQAIAAAFAEPELDETAWARRAAEHAGLPLTTVPIDHREPLDAAVAYQAAWALPAAGARHRHRGAARRARRRHRGRRPARRPRRRRALRRGPLPDRRSRTAPATPVRVAAVAPAPVAGRRPTAAPRPARVHERRRPRGARSRPARAGPPTPAGKRATRRRGCVAARPTSIATARTRGGGSSSTVHAGGRFLADALTLRARDRRSCRLPAPTWRHGGGRSALAASASRARGVRAAPTARDELRPGHLAARSCAEALHGALPADVLARRDKRDFSALHHRALLAPHNLERVRTLLGERRVEVGAYVDLARLRRDLLDHPPPVGAPGWRPWAVHVWNVVTAELWLTHRLTARPRARFANERVEF